MDIFIQKALINPGTGLVVWLLNLTPIHCHYKAGKSRDIL